MRLKRVLVAGALCALLFLSACVGQGGSSPSSVVQRFFLLSNRGHADEALKLVSRESGGSPVLPGMWDAIIRMAGVNFVGTSIEGVKLSGDEATVRYRLRYNPSMYDSAGEVDLVRTDGEWRIWEVR